MWLVLSLSPYYQHKVRRCVGAFNRDFDTPALFTDIFADEGPCVRIHWANRAPNSPQFLRNGWRYGIKANGAVLRSVREMSLSS